MKIIRFFLGIFSLLSLSLACSLTNLGTTSSTPEPYIFEPRDLNNGELRFIVEKAVASETGASPVHGCWPSSYYDDGFGYLIFMKPGVLEGDCHWNSPSQKNLAITWNTAGTLDGVYEQSTGAIIFHMETTAEYPNSSIITVIFDGTGFFTSPTHAEGQASFASTCRSIGKENHCASAPGSTENTRASWDITGSVPWTMDFTVWQR